MAHSVHWDTAAFFSKRRVLVVRNSILLFYHFCCSFSGRPAFGGKKTKKTTSFKMLIRIGLNFKMFWLKFLSLGIPSVPAHLSQAEQQYNHGTM